MPSPELHFNGIAKIYNDGTEVFTDLTGEFSQGIYIILGENGAGKTTFLKCLIHLLDVSKGSVEGWLDASLGYMGQNSSESFYEYQTVFENLEFFASLNEHRLTEVSCRQHLEQFGLGNIVDQRFYKLSGGQKQLVSFVRAFLHEPKIIVLDEPFNNMDPEKVAQMSGFLREYSSSHQALILFSSHTLEQISKIYDEIFYISNHNGRFIGPERVERLFEGLDVCDIYVHQGKSKSFEEFCSSSDEVLYFRKNSQRSYTLLVHSATVLREPSSFVVVQRENPTLSNLSMVLRYREDSGEDEMP